MTDTPPYRMTAQSYFRSPFAPRIHFDEAGAGGDAGAGAGSGQASGAGAGAAAKPWFDGLDPEVRGHIDNKGWKVDDPRAVVTEMAKAWKAAEKFVGAPADQVLKLPKDAADEAGWAAVRQRLGMPKEAKEYDFSSVKFSDGTELDQGFVDALRPALHKAGVAKEIAPEIVRAVVGFMDNADKIETETRNTTMRNEQAALQKEWGSNFEFNRLTAMQGAKRLGVDEATVKQLESSMGFAKTMEMFRKIGAGTNEDTFIQGGTGNPTTTNGAIARKSELMSDPEFVKNYLAGRAKEVNEMNSLIQLISGQAA